MLAAAALFLIALAPDDGAAALAPSDAEPSSECDAKLDEANAKARQQQLKGKHKDALDVLTKVKGACFATVAPRRQAWLVSDMALLAHKRGDDKKCLALLAEAPASLEQDSVIARAIAFNTGLCGGGCKATTATAAAVSPTCEQVERGLVRRRVETGDRSFTAPACSIGSFTGAVGITPPSGLGTACLALVPAASEDGVHWRCPKMTVIEKNAKGQLKRKEILFGEGGAVGDEKQCCNLTDVLVKSGTGSTLVKLRGAGRDCSDGATFGDYDEVFRFDGSALVFDHADDVH